MNLFQSVFSDEPDPSTPESGSESPNPNPSIPTITSAWTFGTTLIQTLASKSESVIETYRRDLQDFTSGIKNETAVIREAATRAVNDIPASLEAGAGLAQDSLESIGQAIDDLIAHGKDSILDVDYSDSDSDVTNPNLNKKIGSTKPYSRLDAQIRMIQSDMNTYLEDPEDEIEYNEWKLGFKFDEKAEEIDDLLNDENCVIGEINREIVPSRVDDGSFWKRYFFRVYKVKKVEEARAKIVKRAISREEEEELSWDVEEDDYDEKTEEEHKILKKKNDDKVGVSESKRVDQIEPEVDNLEAKTDVKTDKDSDISIVSSQPSHEEEGWDEIEDVGSSDEGKDKAVASHGSPIRTDLRKRLSVAAEEEDLTWDIEDEDETVKA